MQSDFEHSGSAHRAMLQPADLFRLAIPRKPRMAPDGRAVLYVREAPDIMTDRIARGLHVVDCAGLVDRPVKLPGDVAFGWWAGTDALIAIVIEASAPDAALVVRVARDGDEIRVIGRLPDCPSQIDVSRDGHRLAMLMKVRSPPHTVALPDQPAGASWSPRARYIDRAVWQVDGIGEIDGVEQLFVMDLRDGTLEQVTTTLIATALFPSGIAWSADGTVIYFATNLDVDWARRQWDCHVHALDLASGRIERLTGGAGSDSDPRVSPDGDWIVYRGFDDTGQFHHAPSLRIMRRDGSARRILADIGQNIGAHAWELDGTGVVFSYIQGGAQHLARVAMDGAITELMSDLAADSHFDVESYLAGGAEFDVADSGVLAVVACPSDPGQIVLRQPDGSRRTLTQLNAGWLPDIALGAVERLDYRAPDGTPIQAWLVYPPHYDPGVRHPLILNIHGGPNLAYGANFAFRFQRYASQGYLVLLVNYRGSAGADMRFYETPSAFPDREFDDLMAGVDVAIDRAAANPARVFVTGLSAGGILTAWTIGKTKRFAAAAVHSPIINWLSHSLTNDLYGSYTDRSFAMMPWEDPLAYWRRSPLSLVADMATPALIIHGEIDSRTPRSEGFQLYHALKLRGIPTAMVLLPESFHIPTRPTQWIEEQQYILEWFANHAGAAAQKEPDHA